MAQKHPTFVKFHDLHEILKTSWNFIKSLFGDFYVFSGFQAPGRLLAPLVQVAARIPYYFIPQDSLFMGGRGRGVSSPGSPLLRLLSSTLPS